MTEDNENQEIEDFYIIEDDTHKEFLGHPEFWF